MIIKNLILLIVYYLFDSVKYLLHSSVFRNDNQDKLEGKINYYYHSIEKGLINEKIRYRFGVSKIKKLLVLIIEWIHRDYDTSNSQFISACSVLMEYYHLHENYEIDISRIINSEELELIKRYSKQNEGGVVDYTREEYFEYQNSSFLEFSNSRHSIRHFNGEIVPTKVIHSVIKLAKNAPSVCNRQSVRVKLVNDEVLVQESLIIQAGMNATAKTVKQLMIVTSNVNYFVSEVERNQMFIDGGIFLQNLLYALHHYGIAACALNWSKPFHYDLRIKKVLDLNPAERVIAAVAIGYPLKEFKVPFSKRKNVEEIFEIIG